jgi:hypothetical protein
MQVPSLSTVLFLTYFYDSEHFKMCYTYADSVSQRDPWFQANKAYDLSGISSFHFI